MALFNKNRNDSGQTWDGQESDRGGAFDVIKWEMRDGDALVHKFPYKNIVTGSKLIVHETQQAFLFKDGALYDSFGAGGHTLTSENIPLLNGILNLPIGSKNTQFTAEVWFVNISVEKMDMGWGDQFIVRDPTYAVPVKMFFRGQYGFKIEDATIFIKKMVGTLHDFSSDELYTKFRDDIASTAKNIVHNFMTKNQQSFDTIASYTVELQAEIKKQLIDLFADYGIGLKKFVIGAIDYDEEDENVRKVLDGLAAGASEKLRMAQLGNTYAQVRQLDIMEQAAQNEGMAGAGMGAGMGMGMGFGMGNMIPNMMNNAMQQQPPQTPPPPPPVAEYYIAQNGQTAGPYSMAQIQQYIRENTVTRSTMAWKNGMGAWAATETIPELAALFQAVPPPPPAM